MERGGTTYWFTPRRYGYGATPATWQGWMTTIAFVAIVGFVALVLFALLPAGWSGLLFAIFVPIAALSFIGFVRKKTDGEWRWRWGKESLRDFRR